MQTKLTNRPIEQVIAAIHALDLEPIRLRVMDAELGEGWTREYAESIERAYRNYLTVLVKHPEDVEDIVVSKEVDEFWHTHILHTMKYTEDCERVFGAYLHHNPHIGKRTPADIDRKAVLAEKTRRLYQREFGSEQTNTSTNATLCAAAIQAENAALCAAAIQLKNTALCAAALEAENAALCAAAIQGESAALCAAAIEVKNTALCAAALKAENAALCAAAIQGESAALCAAAIEVDDAALCAAALRVDNTALCAAAIRAQDVAVPA